MVDELAFIEAEMVKEQDANKNDTVRVLHVPQKGLPYWRLVSAFQIGNYYTRERMMTESIVLCYNDKRKHHPLNVLLKTKLETQKLEIRGQCVFIARDVVTGNTLTLEWKDFDEFWRSKESHEREYINAFDFLTSLYYDLEIDNVVGVDEMCEENALVADKQKRLNVFDAMYPNIKPLRLSVFAAMGGQDEKALVPEGSEGDTPV